MLKKLKIIALGLITLSITACQQTTDDAEIIEAARAGYAAFQQGDMEAWAETQSSDCSEKPTLCGDLLRPAGSDG